MAVEVDRKVADGLEVADMAAVVPVVVKVAVVVVDLEVAVMVAVVPAADLVEVAVVMAEVVPVAVVQVVDPEVEVMVVVDPVEVVIAAVVQAVALVEVDLVAVVMAVVLVEVVPVVDLAAVLVVVVVVVSAPMMVSSKKALAPQVAKSFKRQSRPRTLSKHALLISHLKNWNHKLLKWKVVHFHWKFTLNPLQVVSK